MRALLCDLDGTLVDSRRDLATAVNLLFAELELPPLPLERVVAHIGRGARSLLRRCLDEVGAPIPPDDVRLRRFLTHYEGVLLESTVPFPGVREGLEELRRRGVALAVVTNKPEAPARRILEGLDLLDLLPVILGGDSLPTRKPDPAMLVEAARALGVPLSACVMLGDSDVDIEAAAGAGVPALWCSWGGIHPDCPRRAEVTVRRFEDVVACFSRGPSPGSSPSGPPAGADR